MVIGAWSEVNHSRGQLKLSLGLKEFTWINAKVFWWMRNTRRRDTFCNILFPTRDVWGRMQWPRKFNLPVKLWKRRNSSSPQRAFFWFFRLHAQAISWTVSVNTSIEIVLEKSDFWRMNNQLKKIYDPELSLPNSTWVLITSWQCVRLTGEYYVIHYFGKH